MKKLGVIVFLLLIIVFSIVWFLWNKPFKDISLSNSFSKLSAVELVKEFDDNEELATKKYLNQIVEISGTVSATETNDAGVTSVTLDGGGMSGIICELDTKTTHKRLSFTAGEIVQMKGICTGKLMDIVLSRCVEIK